jgi:hypothetical protein
MLAEPVSVSVSLCMALCMALYMASLLALPKRSVPLRPVRPLDPALLALMRAAGQAVPILTAPPVDLYGKPAHGYNG